MTLSMSTSTRTPVSAPNRVPRPPLRLIPPMTAAANTRKIMPAPWPAAMEPSRPTNRMPASAARIEPTMNTTQTTRSTRIPAARAASALPPMAYSDRPCRNQLNATMPTANSTTQIHTDAGTPSQAARPRYLMELGSSNTDWPPVMAICRPRRVISMPRVTMNALSRTFSTSRPLRAPISAPMARHSGTAVQPGRTPRPLNRLPWVGRTSHTAITGARPTVDSSDRSIRATRRINASASTTRLSSVLCWSTATMLPSCRKNGLAMNPATGSSPITGIRAKSRNRASFGPVRGVGPSTAAGLSRSTTRSVISLTTIRTFALKSFDGGDHLLVAPAAGQLGNHPALEHDDDPVGRAQVIELVGDDQCGAAGGGGHLDRTEQGLLRLHVDAGGRPDQDQYLRCAGQRPTHHDLLLVTAGQGGHRLLRSGSLDVQSLHQRRRGTPPRVPGHEPEPTEPVGDGQGEVLLDGAQRDQALPVPVLGDE